MTDDTFSHDTDPAPAGPCDAEVVGGVAVYRDVESLWELLGWQWGRGGDA